MAVCAAPPSKGSLVSIVASAVAHVVAPAVVDVVVAPAVVTTSAVVSAVVPDVLAWTSEKSRLSVETLAAITITVKINIQLYCLSFNTSLLTLFFK